MPAVVVSLPCEYDRHAGCGLVLPPPAVPAPGLGAWLLAWTRAFSRFPPRLCHCTCHDLVLVETQDRQHTNHPSSG